MPRFARFLVVLTCKQLFFLSFPQWESVGVSITIHPALPGELAAPGRLRVCSASLEDFCFFWGSRDPDELDHGPNLRAVYAAATSSSPNRIVRIIHPQEQFGMLTTIDRAPS